MAAWLLLSPPGLPVISPSLITRSPPPPLLISPHDAPTHPPEASPSQLTRRSATALAAASLSPICAAASPLSLSYPPLSSLPNEQGPPSISCAVEVDIQGAYVSECMRISLRTFSWPSVGKVEIEQGEVAAGSTGAAVWKAGAMLANYLASTEAAGLVEGKAVIELGCGAGLCGVVAGRLRPKSLLLTDASEAVLARASRNVARNLGRTNSLELRQLFWGSVLDDDLVSAFDVVLASDVLYQSSAWRPFAQTAAALLRATSGILLLAEAGHEYTPAESVASGFRTVAEGCGLVFESESEYVDQLYGRMILLRAGRGSA